MLFTYVIYADFNLSNTHAHFVQGGFSVKTGSQNPSEWTPVNQIMEQTATKSQSYLPGDTRLKPKTELSDNRSTCLRQLRGLVCVGQHDYFSHPTYSYQGPQKMRLMISSPLSNWLCPFDPDEGELVSLSAGTAAPAEVDKDLLEAQRLGEKACQASKARALACSCPIYTIPWQDFKEETDGWLVRV